MKKPMIKDSAKFNRWFNAFILLGMTLVMAVTTAIKLASGEGDGSAMILIAAFGSMMGILSTLCSANARILTFLFGFFDVAIYGAMCIMSANYGNGALHLLYFLPMQFVGFFQWRKRGASSGGSVHARRLSPKQRITASLAFLGGLVLLYFVLLSLGHEQLLGPLRIAILMDAFSTVCNIIGQLLMSTAYMEQWFFWIGVNISSVIMWTATLLSGAGDSDYASIYIIKYSFYLLNSLNGLRIWMALSRKDLDN